MSKRLSKHIIADKRFKSRLSHKEEKLRHKIKHEKELLHYAKLEENYHKLHQRLKDSKHPKHKKQLAQASAEIKAHRKRIYKKHPYHTNYFAFVHKKPVREVHMHMTAEVVIPSPPASQSYLDITLDVMQMFGANVTRDGYARFRVSNRRPYAGRTYTIEGDYSSASYLFAIAAVSGGRVTVKNLVPDSVQGDRRFLDALRLMGCTVTHAGNAVTIERTGDLKGITLDMSSSPDTVQTLCMVAAMAKTPTTITGIGHLKFKESDRISSTAERLQALGGNVRFEDDRITIYPSPLHGCVISPEMTTGQR